eukprot:151317-Chlamydomonas_euryale.AAC.21
MAVVHGHLQVVPTALHAAVCGPMQRALDSGFMHTLQSTARLWPATQQGWACMHGERGRRCLRACTCRHLACLRRHMRCMAHTNARMIALSTLVLARDECGRFCVPNAAWCRWAA